MLFRRAFRMKEPLNYKFQFKKKKILTFDNCIGLGKFDKIVITKRNMLARVKICSKIYQNLNSKL